MKRCFMAALTALLAMMPGVAGADSSRTSDPAGDVSLVGWDISSLSSSHRNGKLLHRLRLRGSWQPSDLEPQGRAAMRFVFAPNASGEWRYAVQVLWDKSEGKLKAALLDYSQEEPYQGQIPVRRWSDGVQIKFHRWAIGRPRSYSVGAYTAVKSSRDGCDEGFVDGVCRDSVAFSGNFTHRL